MKALRILMKRNIKLFFKDKGMFFTALVTPGILLVLYATFLGNVYRDSFTSALPMEISGKLIDGFVGGQLVSSLLAVSAVTVAFCSNMLMVQDKVTGAGKDLRISPVSPSVLAIGYYLATFVSTLTVCLAATALCLGYIAIVGWYLSVADVALLLLDVLLLAFFGTALSSLINLFLSSQGQISAVGTIVSAGYGFICGAYMPISQFSEGLRNAVAFLPGTHGTALLRRHAMDGVLSAMEKEGVPAEALAALSDLVDCNLYLFGDRIPLSAMYAVLVGAVILLVAGYVLLHVLRERRK